MNTTTTAIITLKVLGTMLMRREPSITRFLEAMVSELIEFGFDILRYSLAAVVFLVKAEWYQYKTEFTPIDNLEPSLLCLGGQPNNQGTEAMNTTTTPIDQAEVTVPAPIDQAKFAARYVRYNMASHGMTQLQPEAVAAIAAVDQTPTIEDIELEMTQATGHTFEELVRDFTPITEAYVLEMPKIEEQLLPQQWKPSMRWTKADMVKACQCYGLKTTGNKAQLLLRLQAELA